MRENEHITDNIKLQYVYITCMFYLLIRHYFGLVWFLVFNATFSNISAILWRPVLVVEEAGENH